MIQNTFNPVKIDMLGQPFATNDVGENHEVDEVNFGRPPRFGEHEEEEEDDDKSACEAFVILDSPQKVESKRVEIA